MARTSEVLTAADKNNLDVLDNYTGNSLKVLRVNTGETALEWASAGGAGTVTSIAAGNGMNFTTITGTGSVTLGTPSTCTNATTNSVSGTTHTHAISVTATIPNIFSGLYLNVASKIQNGSGLIYSDTDLVIPSFSEGSGIINILDGVNKNFETRDFTSDWADADSCVGLSKIGNYLYAILHDTGTITSRVYRYAFNNLAAGGTLMTAAFLGTTAASYMTSDGTYLYFSNDGGDSADDWKILRASISGTTLTEEEVIIVGAATISSKFAVDTSYIYVLQNSVYKKYNKSAVLQTSTDGNTLTSTPAWNIAGNIFDYDESTYQLTKNVLQ